MQIDPQETTRLLDQVRAGQPGSLDALLGRHREPLRRMIGLRLDPMIAGRRVDASDLVQEVLLEASRRLDDYLRRPSMPFGLWLRHLARDQVIDAHRRHRQAQRRSLDREQRLQPGLPDRSSLDLAAEFLKDRELTPATAALREELRRRLESAVAALDDDDRELVVMRHYEQMSNRDVAADLGLTEAAASMRYLRALRRLRSLLSGEENEH